MKTALLAIALFFFQSCALMTSFSSFKLERGKKTSFQTQHVFTDKLDNTVVFFEDGTLLVIQDLPPENITKYIEKNNYKIYKKFDDYRFKWGVYRISNDTVSFELHEKVHQWGFIEICRWEATLKDDSLKVLPIKKKISGGLDFYTFSKDGAILKTADRKLIGTSLINHKLAWVNK